MTAAELAIVLPDPTGEIEVDEAKRRLAADARGSALEIAGQILQRTVTE